jgi:hypothetical protein
MRLQSRLLGVLSLVESSLRVVAVAQLVEHRIVAPKVAGSSPVGHPFVCGYNAVLLFVCTAVPPLIYFATATGRCRGRFRRSLHPDKLRVDAGAVFRSTCLDGRTDRRSPGLDGGPDARVPYEMDRY